MLNLAQIFLVHIMYPHNREQENIRNKMEKEYCLLLDGELPGVDERNRPTTKAAFYLVAVPTLRVQPFKAMLTQKGNTMRGKVTIRNLSRPD